MAVSRIESLVAALANLNGFCDPRSEAFQLRNPLLLRGYSFKHVVNDKGLRQFQNFASGWDNCVSDLRIKVSGKSRTNLTPFSTLDDLVKYFGHRAATRTVKNFLQAALGDDQISERTQIRYFDSEISAIDALASTAGTANSDNFDGYRVLRQKGDVDRAA